MKFEKIVQDYANDLKKEIETAKSSREFTPELSAGTTPFNWTVDFVAGANGSITGNLNQVVAHGGSSTAVDPAGDTGYHFVNWTGDYTGTDDPLTVTNVTSNMTITANFAINTYCRYSTFLFWTCWGDFT